MNETIFEEKKKGIEVKPKLAFLGVGWIGRSRMEAIGSSGYGEIVAISDPNEENATQAVQMFPKASIVPSLEEILENDEIDGVVIATPSALHAEQAVRAIQRGKAVFCQKPLARDEEETKMVVHAAQSYDKLLSVDFSYRFTNAMEFVHQIIQSSELGNIYSVQLTFHNAYGPDKSWFYNKSLSGGGCVMDLGIHLIDLALWCLGFPEVKNVNSRLYQKGQLLVNTEEAVEDYAFASIDLENDTHLNLNCSWNLPAGKEAIIEVVFYGSKGGAAFRNKNGSFYDFTSERFSGTKTELLFDGHDAWGGRAGIDWARRLHDGTGYDDANQDLLKVASLIDRIYGK